MEEKSYLKWHCEILRRLMILFSFLTNEERKNKMMTILSICKITAVILDQVSECSGTAEMLHGTEV